MKLLRLTTCAALIALTASSWAHAAAGPARTALDHFAQGLHALSGNFQQTLTDPSGKTQQTSGTLVLEAPRQFRWDTQAPSKSLLVADGSRVWMYDPDLEQVTVRRQDSEEAHSPLTILTDLAQLDRDFSTSEQGQRDGLSWLRLTSKGDNPGFAYVDLGFDANGLARMQFKDQLGAVSDIRFSGWQRNPSIPPQDFNFTPPKGADVVGDLPSMQTTPLKQ